MLFPKQKKGYKCKIISKIFVRHVSSKTCLIVFTLSPTCKKHNVLIYFIMNKNIKLKHVL